MFWHRWNSSTWTLHLSKETSGNLCKFINNNNNYHPWFTHLQMCAQCELNSRTFALLYLIFLHCSNLNQSIIKIIRDKSTWKVILNELFYYCTNSNNQYYCSCRCWQSMCLYVCVGRLGLYLNSNNAFSCYYLCIFSSMAFTARSFCKFINYLFLHCN